MRKQLASGMLVTALFCTIALAQEPVDEQAIARIKFEGFQNSQVMDHVFHLADVYGPRLQNSPNIKAAGEWAVKRLTEYGLVDAHLEPWGEFGPGWTLKKISMEMTTPQYMPIIAYPKAWTPGTNGTLSGSPVIVEIRSPADFDRYRGKLRGAIVMNGRVSGADLKFAANGVRFADSDLQAMSLAMDPGPPNDFSEVMESRRQTRERLEEMARFFFDEGVAALVEPSVRDHLVVEVSRQSYNLDITRHVPAVVIGREHYGRLQRLIDHKIPVQVALDVEVETQNADTRAYNVIAEIPGSDPALKDQVVMLGGHLDSWHSGTGATDNGAGCAAVIEAVRLLEAAGLEPRRTIRIALWSSEENGHMGSLGYMKLHFGNPETGEIKPDQQKLSAYYNLDNGSGRIRGIYLQGNEAVRPIFEAWLAPFHYLAAETITVRNTTGTDHQEFDATGIPGFQFIQDPLEYGSVNHHTNLDVYEAVSEDDLQQAAVIIASFVYQTAQRPEMMPRKPRASTKP